MEKEIGFWLKRKNNLYSSFKLCQGMILNALSKAAVADHWWSVRSEGLATAAIKNEPISRDGVNP